MPKRQDGFTIIELLVTLIVAAIFVIAGFQLYTVVLRVDGQTRSQTIAQNTAQDYLERYRTSVPSPCVASTPLVNSPITVTGLTNVTISVTVSCPKSSTISALSKIDVLIQYNNPQVQLAYSAWSYAPDACGAGYVLVPGDSRFDTPTFCVMKYEAKNVNGQAISQAAGTPWVNISQNDAITAAAAACPSCHLMSEAEWMTVAANVLYVPSNWSGGAVGSGAMYVGHTDNAPASALAASSDDTQGYYGETNTGGNQRRTLTLNNGEIIWDLSGNAWEWTNATIGAGQSPGLSGEVSNNWKEWNNTSMLWNGFPALSRPSAISPQAASWTSAQSIGTICSNYGSTTTEGYLRGSSYMDIVPSYDGVLSLYACAPPTFTNPNVGFRVAKSIDGQPEQFAQPTSCPTGFIPVPGDARFGTIGFCVMKYEAKNDGNGNAVSTAAGVPWVNISQTQAISQSQAACAGCHLITDAEWMTIAANVLLVPSNWSGGAVGSGYIYSGHNDGSPLNSLAADTNDANGYYGETSPPTNQRRTLTLSNGQVIWDLAGNVWEWTQGSIAGGQQPGIPAINGYAWVDWNDNSIVWNGFPGWGLPSYVTTAASTWSADQGIGRLWSNYYETAAHGILRGSYFGDGSNAGVLSVTLTRPASWSDGGIGFRVASYGYGPVAVPAQVLVVAGGGGGGRGGGGGAGGVIFTTTSVIYPSDSYTVTVGAGGAGSATDIGYNGGNSSFNGLTAIGGGGGGGNGNTTAATPGNSGGSGGGGGLSVSGTDGAAGGSGTPGQGYGGGYGTAASCSPSGGGGGAGAAGQSGIAGSKAGDGGTGIAIPITGTNIYYGGGGGGASWCLGQGAGGNGGGGAGSSTSGVAGTPNTGGGGGGGAINGSGTGGAPGGSGVVIIRYPTGSMTATGGTITYSGGYTIHTFTSSGTFTVN